MMQTNAPNLTWQMALQNAVTNVAELFSILELDPANLPAAFVADKLFALKVPREYITRIKKGDENDPLLLQILPLGLETQAVVGYENDPLGEQNCNPVPGLLHKYHGRVLLTLTSVCAINCRFCFRRHFPYSENNPGNSGWDKALDYIRQDPNISEVILSGGDPLIAQDKTLRQLSQKLEMIPHIKRLRIHTRLPIILPERITPEFIQWLKELKLQAIIVTHCNHPNELTPNVVAVVDHLKKAGVVMLNQSVLLKGINTHPDILVNLSEKLFAIGIQPYYLHLLDKVAGAAHFDIPIDQATALYAELTARLSGYLVPKFVYEKANAPAKLSASDLTFTQIN